MSSIMFLAGLVVTLISALAIVAYLRAPLYSILVELCGTRERAAFWVAFSNVTLALLPLIFAMQYTPEVKPGTSVVLEVAAQLKWALAGLLRVDIKVRNRSPLERETSSTPSTT